MQAGIQADDLTGACDAGAPFAARGLSTAVLLPDAPDPPEWPDVLVLDTESRTRSGAEARALARAAAARLAARRPAVLYKKVDSTLRGALAAELVGALEGAGLDRVVLAPAFPAQRRTVRDGRLLVDGRPAEEGAIAQDPDFPPTGSSVLACLAIEPGRRLRPVTLVPRATVRQGCDAVAARLARFPATFVADAETDADLDTLAAATSGATLLAGSAGFGAAVAARLGAAPSVAPVRLPAPLLVVAGSTHPATRAQVDALGARGARTHRVGADHAALPGGDGALILAPVDPTTPGLDRDAMAAALADLVRRVLERPRAPGRQGTLCLTGGETAVAVCRALGATGIRLAGELERGLARGSLLDGPFAGLTVITKAGGFGDVDTLVRVWEAAA